MATQQHPNGTNGLISKRARGLWDEKFTPNSSQSPKPRNGSDGSFSNLPPELILKILDHLRPVGPLTTYESTLARPEIHHNYVESRSSFSSLSRVSKLIHRFASGYLYRAVLVRDQRELLRFFRTLANDPDLRSTVRSFAWVGLLSTDETNLESTMLLDDETAAMASDCWASISWPSTPVDCRIAQLMGIDGPHTLGGWRVLGAVLGMASKLKSLFMLHGSRSAGSIAPGSFPLCPERDAIWPLIRPVAADNNELDQTQPDPRGPFACQFLQELEVITLEDNINPENDVTGDTLTALLLNSPSLRRIELKGDAFFSEVLGTFRYLRGDPPIPMKVKEILHFHALDLLGEMMVLVTAFPKLVSFQAEYLLGNSAFYSTPPPEISEALLRISGTLETLSLTTVLGKRWWRLEISQPSLKNLSQMVALKNLTTESIWLFGRQMENSAIALRLPHRLPPSLIRFKLIDYWGTYDEEFFYPGLPNDWTPLEFYDHVFSRLHEECPTCLPNLRDIALVSDTLHPHAAVVVGSHGQDHATQVYAFLIKFRGLFEEVGVRFSVITPERAAAPLRSSWANLARVDLTVLVTEVASERVLVPSKVLVIARPVELVLQVDGGDGEREYVVIIDVGGCTWQSGSRLTLQR